MRLENANDDDEEGDGKNLIFIVDVIEAVQALYEDVTILYKYQRSSWLRTGKTWRVRISNHFQLHRRPYQIL